MEMIALILAGLFLMYKLGLIEFLQTNINRGTNLVDKNLELMEEKSDEKHTRDLGKLVSKYADESVPRADRKLLADAKKSAIERVRQQHTGADND